VPQVKHFEENRIGGMRPAAVAAAGSQMSAQRGSGRITGQQRIGQSDACVLFLVTRFAQFLFQMDFELAEKTTASGTSSHNRPPEWLAMGLPHGLRVSVSQRILSFLPAAGRWPAAVPRDEMRKSFPLARRNPWNPERGRNAEILLADTRVCAVFLFPDA
jgi:hypothetical protein